MTGVLCCPFCGHDDPEIDEIEYLVWAICCPGCNTIGPVKRRIDGTSKQSPQRAIELWNRRAVTA